MAHRLAPTIFMNKRLACDGYCCCQLNGKYSWKISCAMKSSIEFNPKYVKGAPVHNLCTSTSIYTIDNMIIPKPEVTKPKEADHRFLFTGTKPSF